MALLASVPSDAVVSNNVSGALSTDKTLNAAVVAASVASVGVVAGFATSTIFGVTSVATLAALASHK